MLYTAMSPEMTEDLRAFHNITRSELEEKLTKHYKQEVYVEILGMFSKLRKPEDINLHIQFNYKSNQAVIYTQRVKNGVRETPELLFKKQLKTSNINKPSVIEKTTGNKKSKKTAKKAKSTRKK